MALIACHECGKEISDQAEACPHCGAPVKKPEPPKVEDMTPEELNQLAEQQRMKMMGIKPKSNLEAVAGGTAKAAAGAYGAGCGLMTLLSFVFGLLMLFVIPPVGIVLVLLGIAGLLVRR